MAINFTFFSLSVDFFVFPMKSEMKCFKLNYGNSQKKYFLVLLNYFWEGEDKFSICPHLLFLFFIFFLLKIKSSRIFIYITVEIFRKHCSPN